MRKIPSGAPRGKEELLLEAMTSGHSSQEVSWRRRRVGLTLTGPGRSRTTTLTLDQVSNHNQNQPLPHPLKLQLHSEDAIKGPQKKLERSGCASPQSGKNRNCLTGLFLGCFTSFCVPPVSAVNHGHRRDHPNSTGWVILGQLGTKIHSRDQSVLGTVIYYYCNYSITTVISGNSQSQQESRKYFTPLFDVNLGSY